MSTLVIKNDGIGDLILCSGLLADLAEQIGPLDLVTCSENREIAENIPGLRTVHYVSRDHIRYQPLLARFGVHWVCGTKQDRNVFSRLQAHHYNTAICLRRYIRQSSLLLMQAVRADRKECCWRWPSNASPALGDKLSKGWNRYTGGGQERSELSYYRAFIANRLGLDSRSRPRLAITQTIMPKPEMNWIGLCLSGGFKNWPLEHWVGLAKALHQNGKKIILFGGPDAITCETAIKAAVPMATSHVNQLGFVASARELARLELLVSNDTGFAHFASIVTKQVLVIMGGGTFDHFFPWPEQSGQHVIYHGLSCFGCNWACSFPTMKCFEQITVHSVLQYIDSILSGAASTTHNVGTRVPKMCPDVI